MSFSILDICNLALIKIGSAKIVALTDKDDVNLSKIYSQIRDQLLIQYPWNFARTREELSPNDEAPAFEWDYEYDLPVDYLGRPELYDTMAEFVIEGTSLLCNDDVIYLKYTTQITDTSLFTNIFIDCLVLAIASELAIPITNDQKLKLSLLQELKMKLLDGFLANEYENNFAEAEINSSWQTIGHVGLTENYYRKIT
jgi:hypothetical protein